MAKLEILEYPDPGLRKVAKRVEEVDGKIRQLIEDMAETMYAEEGCGLAAIQVNVQKRIFIMDFSLDQTSLEVFINPEVIPLCNEASEFAEGCLSVPGFFENLHRPKRVMVKALDKHGEPFEKEFEGLHAVCVQHENDHLDGKLLVDQLTKLKRDRIRTKLEKRKQQQRRQR